MIDLKNIKDVSLDNKQIDNLIIIEYINGHQTVLVNKQVLKELTGYDTIVDIFKLYDNKKYITDVNEIDAVRNKKGELRIMDFNNFTGLFNSYLKLNTYHKDLLKNNKVIKTPINEDFINKKAYLNDNILINTPNNYCIRNELKVVNSDTEIKHNIKDIIRNIKSNKFSKIDSIHVDLNSEYTTYTNDNENVLSVWDLHTKLNTLELDILSKYINDLFGKDIVYLNGYTNELLLKYIFHKLQDEVLKGIVNLDKIKSFNEIFENVKHRTFTTLIYYILRQNHVDFSVWIVEFLELFLEFYENKMSIINDKYEILGYAPYNNFKRDYKIVAEFVKKLVILQATKANFIKNHVLLDYCCERSLTTSNNFPFQQFLSILTSSYPNKLKIKMLHNLFYKVKKNKLNSLILYRVGELLNFMGIVTKEIDNSLTLIKYAQSYYSTDLNITYNYAMVSTNLINEIAQLFNEKDNWNRNNITLKELKNLLTTEEYFDVILFLGVSDFLINYKYQFVDYSAALSTFLDKYTKFIQAINNGDTEDTFIKLKGDIYNREITIDFQKYLINGYAKS